MAVALVIIAGAYFLSVFISSLKEEPEVKKKPVVKKYVQTAPVQYSDLKTHVITYGRVENAQSLDMIAEVSGRMTEGVRLKEGQSFKKGDLIFKIDDEEARLNLKSQKSNFLRDLAGILPDLKIDFSDNFSTWQAYFNQLDIDKRFPSLPKVTTEKEKTFLATRGIYSAYYAIQSAEVRLEKYRYYAPFSGSIMEVALQSGSFVNAGTRIGKILRLGTHEMRVSVETRDIPWIREGSSVDIYSEEAQQSLRGQVTRISDYVNQNTQSVDVFIAINAEGMKIYDGQYFKAAMPARTVKNGMIMPRSALYNGNEVFVLEDSFLRRKTVNIIRLAEDDAIFNGLMPGEELVVEPLLGAFNNMKAFKKEQKDIDVELREGEDVQVSKKSSTAEKIN